MAELDEITITEIHRLCARGDRLADQGQVDEALDSYWAAWDLLPEPRSDWPVSAWILGAIADIVFCQGDYLESLTQFLGALGCRDADAMALLHLRVGECRYELGDMDAAEAELREALRIEGPGVFDDEHPKYREFLAGRRRDADARG